MKTICDNPFAAHSGVARELDGVGVLATQSLPPAMNHALKEA